MDETIVDLILSHDRKAKEEKPVLKEVPLIPDDDIEINEIPESMEGTEEINEHFEGISLEIEHPVITDNQRKNIDSVYALKQHMIKIIRDYNGVVEKIREKGGIETLAHDEETGRIMLINVTFNLKV